ncbi:MAG: DUF1499 domain-containing protein [Gammaproteobacteria bacterium]|nr:DUF1499 domain-containing protein [Gammaproteobacteria bacterium]MBT7878832.1 DUF1499 domain-containing protein [Gammaproteobacteria bacterium]
METEVMEEVKTSTRVLLVSAIVLLIILVTGPLGYKFSMVPLQPSLVSLLIAVAGGALVFLVGLVYLVIAMRSDLGRNRNLVFVSMIMGLVPVGIIGPQMAAAGNVPPIHDITTDTANPPAFVAILPLRENAPNGYEYGVSEAWPAEKLGATTMEAYPGLKPIESDLSAADAVDRTEATLQGMGLEIVAVDKEAGLVEATATTFWFGFKDDMVVRIVANGEGSKIDLRSMSRVGQSDVGANAARISDFVERF